MATTVTMCGLVASAASYYVDSGGGNDANDGLKPESAWQSLARVSTATLVPGDEVLFKRGGLWRGVLVPRSGEPGKPVRYAEYGEGPLPILQGSVAADAPADWEEVTPGVWRTLSARMTDHQPIETDAATKPWGRHQEGGAAVAISNATNEQGLNVVTLQVEKSGVSSNHVQLWGPEMPEFAECMVLHMRGRSSKATRLEGINICQNTLPWTRYANGRADVTLGDDWQDFQIVFERELGAAPTLRLLHLSLGGVLPAEATIALQIVRAESCRRVGGMALPVDVGNVIFDHGRACGWKKWSEDALVNVGDYYYSPYSQSVYLRHDGNPSVANKSIELALRTTIISQGSAHDVLYENLAVRYGAAHGFGGGGTKRIVIRGCDIYYIGGGHQYTKNGRPVRFGNGIEFWGNADGNLVENNRLWEIYDAALTNQGRGDGNKNRSFETNITYRNNVIWNAEYSFEYWNNDVTENIFFVNNTCVDAGTVWSHAQRPNPNGAHLMFYNNPAKTKNFVVRDNIFVNSTEVCMRMWNVWQEPPQLDYNLWQGGGQPLVRFEKKGVFGADNFAAYQQEFGFDRNSLIAEPVFVDPSRRDYRLAPDSPGLRGASDGGAFGARLP